jgi:protein dithiol oxidoreductase (disulfide-forming)
MTRKLTLLTLAAAVLVALGVWLWHTQPSRQTSQATAQTDEAAAPSTDSSQSTVSAPAAAPDAQSAPASGGAVSTAQASDAGSTSLEHLAGLPASGALPSSAAWKPNTNYTVISPAQPTTAPPGKVEVLEVFWLGCPHCYALEPYVRQWLKTKPAYVDFVRVPVMWGPMHRAHARLFYTLESLGRDDLVEKVFTYIHETEQQTGNESVLVSNSDPNTFQEQQAWAVQNGISADAFAKAYNSFYVNTQLQQAEEITNNYEVQGVPFFAIDGKFTSDVEKAGGPDKLISLINFLATWEHDHRQGSG